MPTARSAVADVRPFRIVTMGTKPPREVYDEVLAMTAKGLKPFQIVKQVMAKASRAEVVLAGTLNNSQLVFRSGEMITFDGREWRYEPALSDDDAEA